MGSPNGSLLEIILHFEKHNKYNYIQSQVTKKKREM